MHIHPETFEISDYLGRSFDCDCGRHHKVGLKKVVINDKAMDSIYAKANVKEVEPKAPEAGAEADAAPGASASAQESK